MLTFQQLKKVRMHETHRTGMTGFPMDDSFWEDLYQLFKERFIQEQMADKFRQDKEPTK